jgi:hypothetical protein
MSKKSKRRARAAETALAVDPPIERAPMWGSQFVDSIRLSDEQLNTVFIGWFLTALLVFGLGNIFLGDAAVLAASGKVTLVCLGFIAVAYSLSRVCGHPLIGVLLTMVAAWGFTYARQGWLVPVVWVVGAAAAGYCVWHIRVKPRTLVLMLLAAAITAVMSMGCPKNFTTFDMIPRLNAGYVHMDTLYHAAMAAMIKNYGVTSSGLQGLVETPYHSFSHSLFAAISTISNVSVIEVYGVVPWVLFAPMLIFGVAACVAAVDRSSSIAVPLVWGGSAALMVLLPATFEIWRWESFLPSESQTLAMGLMVLALPMLLKHRLTVLDGLIVALLAWALSSCKGPVGIMTAGLWLSRLLFFPGMGRLGLLPIVMAMILVVVLTNARLAASSVSGDAASIVPLHFVSSYAWNGRAVGEVVNAVRSSQPVPLSAWMTAAWTVVVFVGIHFVLSWVAVVVAALSGGRKALRAWPVIAMTICAVAACCVGVAFIRMPFMNLFWFTSVTFFIAMPAVVAWAALPIGRSSALCASALILAAGVTLLVNQRGLSEWTAAAAGGVARPGALQWVRAGAPRRATENDFVSDLRRARIEVPVNTLLVSSLGFAGQTNLTQCMAMPFMFPAVSERPWRDVIDLNSGCQYRMWGYDSYIIQAPSVRLVEPVAPTASTLVAWP